MSSFNAPMWILAISLFYVNKPVVDMRENPTHESRVVSQTLFFENVILEKNFEDWVYITTPDRYSGWVPSNSFVVLNKPYSPSLKVSRLAAHLYGLKDIEFGPIKTLPYGSKLQSLDETDLRWIKIALPGGEEYYIQKGDVALENKIYKKEDLVAFSQNFLGIPYTWGGRSSFGYDCSGFIQMLYNQIGIELQRDSKLQVKDCRFQTVSIDDIEPGDLIFFGQSEQEISHVGMYLGHRQFIHATVRENKPWIRLSHLSDFEWSGHKDVTFPYQIIRQFIAK